MRKLKLFLCLSILLDMLAGYVGFAPMPGAMAQIPPSITYVTTAQNWTQTTSSALTGGSPGTVVLTPCPTGADYASGAGYQVYIADGASSEAVSVTGGATGSGNCTIALTPFFSHPLSGSYTIGSASSGIQEAINVACGVSSSPNFNGQCNVTTPSNGPYISGPTFTLNNYDVYGTIFWHASQSAFNGTGTTLFCHGRGPCLQVGDQVSSNHYIHNTIQGLTFRSPDNHSPSGDNNPAYQGCAITQTQVVATSVATITTATSCGFRPGDLVTIQFTDDSMYWGDAIVATASGTTFTFTKHSFPTTKAAQSTPGVANLAFEAILDNAGGTHFSDISYDHGGNLGNFNNFFDFWDDENALIEHFNNNGIPLLGNANWVGSFVYSGGGPIGPTGSPNQQWAPVITVRDSSITANFSNCVTVDNSNGVYIENTVCQASSPWQVKTSIIRGNFQGAYLKNIYSESNAGLNPLSPAHNPFAGTGIAGLIAGLGGSGNYEISGGSSTLSGGFTTGGTGGTAYSYFIVANCVGTGTGGSCPSGPGSQTSPMQVLNWLSTGSDSPVVLWPRIANGTDTITYDVIRMTTPVGVGAIFPYIGGCPGGAGGACGYVAFGLTQAAACSGGLVCTYTDNTATDCAGISAPSTCAYAIKQGNYAGQINFWPGALVVETATVATSVEQAPVVAVGLNGNPAQTMTTCSALGGTSASGGYTQCTGSKTTANNAVKNQTATILTDGGFSGGGQALTKGRLNFSTTSAYMLLPHHIITLIDSQPDLTKSTSVYRPPASIYDTWIGTDVAASGVALNLGKLAFGAPVAISNYIAHTGDGINQNWLEQLTSTKKVFKVPIQITVGAFSVLPACTAGTEGMQGAVNDSTTNTWGATITGGGANHVLAYCDGTNWTVVGK